MRYECDVYATCVVPCYKIVFIFRNICMAIGIDVSIYAKTELLLSPLGVRIVAKAIYPLNIVYRLQSPRGARIVALPYIHAVGTEWLQSPQGARIVARCWRYRVFVGQVTVPARGANCSYNYAGIQCKGHLFSGYLYTIFHLIFYIVVQNP